MSNALFEKEELRKIPYGMGENRTDIDFVVVGKSNRKYLKDKNVIF